MKIFVQLYDENGHGCGCFYNDVDTIKDLLVYLDNISDNGYFTYEIGELKKEEEK